MVLRITAEPLVDREFAASESLKVLKSVKCSPRPEPEDSVPASDLKKET